MVDLCDAHSRREKAEPQSGGSDVTSACRSRRKRANSGRNRRQNGIRAGECPQGDFPASERRDLRSETFDRRGVCRRRGSL